MPQLGTIGKHEEKVPMPFGLDGYVVVRRRYHPEGKGRWYDSQGQRRDVEDAMVMEPIKERLREGLQAEGFDGDLEAEVIKRFTKDPEGRRLATQRVLHAVGDEVAQEATVLACSLIKTWGGPCFEEKQPGKKVDTKSVINAFFSDDERAQIVPRFETLDGVPVVDVDLMRDADSVCKAFIKDREQEKGREDFADWAEKRIAQRNKALETLGVRLCPHGGKTLDVALIDFVIGEADRLEAALKEAAGFFAEP